MSSSINGEDPLSVVDAYLDALSVHDYDRARGYLADEGFVYESPISVFSSADDLIQHLSLAGGIMQRLERRKVFTDGADVCHLLRFTIQISQKETVKAAQWTRVAEGRIQSIDILFDASPYRSLFEV
jgi:hypothetical protein